MQKENLRLFEINNIISWCINFQLLDEKVIDSLEDLVACCSSGVVPLSLVTFRHNTILFLYLMVGSLQHKSGLSHMNEDIF